jgi:aerobic-type carbon monoxide dehydrogenase small subunit (CoxS/CutS family)
MTGRVAILINGETVAADAGVSLGSLLHARGKALRLSPGAGAPRGLYCGMGVCFECVVTVDGRPERACITTVRDGMAVEVPA